MHYTGFLKCMPHLGGDDIPEKEKIAFADLIIFQRNCIVPEVIQAIKYWQALGKPVVIDLDDAYHILPPSNPAYNFWIRDGGRLDNIETFSKLAQGEPLPDSEVLGYLQEGLSVSSGLISPSRMILNHWGAVAVGDKQYYLQNYAERDWWENLPSRDELKEKDGLAGKIVIGWGGSISHLDSFWGSGLYEALRRVCRRYPQVVVKICGNDGRLEKFLDIADDQLRRQPGVPPEDWPKQVKTFDIGLAPLYGSYDQHRSWIKGIEYLLAGAPWVGTVANGLMGTYADLNGLGRLIVNSTQNWELALIKIIENLEAEQKWAASMIPAAQKKFIVDYNLDVYAKVYRQIINDFQRDGAGGGVLLPEVAHVKIA